MQPDRRDSPGTWKQDTLCECPHRMSFALQAAVLGNDATPFKDVIATLCQRATLSAQEKCNGTAIWPYMLRALNPLSPNNLQRLTIIAQPKFVIAGLRRADVRVALFGAVPTEVRNMPVNLRCLQYHDFWS